MPGPKVKMYVLHIGLAPDERESQSICHQSVFCVRITDEKGYRRYERVLSQGLRPMQYKVRE